MDMLGYEPARHAQHVVRVVTLQFKWNLGLSDDANGVVSTGPQTGPRGDAMAVSRSLQQMTAVPPS